MSALLLLDTNICIYVMNRRPPELLLRFEQAQAHLAISTITLAELRFGAANSRQPAHNHAQIDQFCQYIDVLDFSAEAARHYGDIRATLKQQGQLIGDNDLLIAAHALALDATLVTNNTREFERVYGLKLENWC
jgi:tRNA(fMet)-specific endonuclease VapC